MKSEGLKLLIQAGNPIISMETPDEPRAAHLVHEVAEAMSLPLVEWSVTEGLRSMPPMAAADAGGTRARSPRRWDT